MCVCVYTCTYLCVCEQTIYLVCCIDRVYSDCLVLQFDLQLHTFNEGGKENEECVLSLEVAEQRGTGDKQGRDLCMWTSPGGSKTLYMKFYLA